jgi:ATP-dependent DNA ligase
MPRCYRIHRSGSPRFCDDARAAVSRCLAARLLRSRWKLVYAGRVGTGINQAELALRWRRLQPLAIDKMPLDVAPPRSTRFGSPLVLSRVHWVRPELVAEVKYLTWTEDNLLRQVVYEGLREDKPAAEVRRPVPHPKTDAVSSRK